LENTVSLLPKLYATLEVGSDGAAATDALQAVLNSDAVACLLLCPKAGAALDPSVTKRLVGMAQKRGVATLIANDANLARLLKADGLHLSWSKNPEKLYREARADLGEHAMIGVDAGRSRDDAMVLGEAGADYVAFGIPAHVEDRATAEDRQRDLISWWGEIFQVPCVAFDVASVDHASALAGDGADFIAVTLTSEMTPDALRETIAGYLAAITPTEVTA
jgi:thiamine-phosphate pyrophosphorylase